MSHPELMESTDAQRSESASSSRSAAKRPTLAAIGEAYELMVRGVLSGLDVSRLLDRLAELLDADIAIVEAPGLEDAESLATGSCIRGNELLLRVGPTWSLRARCREPSFSCETIDTIRLLALPLATCLRHPGAERALRAPSDERIEDALERLRLTVRLNSQGDILEWSAAARQALRELGKDCDSEHLRAVVLAASQRFAAGRRNLQRLVPPLFISFAYLGWNRSAPDVVIGVLHFADEVLSPDLDSPVVPLLSKSELIIARRLSLGARESTIGRALGVSTETVKTHRKHIYEKLGIASRLELVPFFNRQGS